MAKEMVEEEVPNNYHAKEDIFDKYHAEEDIHNYHTKQTSRFLDYYTMFSSCLVVTGEMESTELYISLCRRSCELCLCFVIL